MNIPKSYNKSLNRHQIELEKFFGADRLIDPEDLEFDYPEIVFICFTNRSGSNYLAELLGSTGKLNTAGEILNYDFVELVCVKQSITYFSKYFLGMVHANKIGGHVVIKASPEQILMLSDWGVLQPIAHKIKFLSIERSNKIDQAISFLIAEQSGQWASFNDNQGDDLVFDTGTLLAKLSYIHMQHDYMDQFFLLNGIVAYKLTYEHLVDNTEQELASIAQFLNITVTLPLNIDKLATKRQATVLNKLFRDKFISWLGVNDDFR